jgi:hypothetical protein
MPTLRTIITDLHNRTAMGIGMTCQGGGEQSATLSDGHFVTELATPVTVSFGAAPNYRVTFTAGARNATNGYYLFYQDGWSTVATLTRVHRIGASGDFAGCLYSVYHDGTGRYKCVHTSRPSGSKSETYVKHLRKYAADQGWTLVHEIPTTGGLPTKRFFGRNRPGVPGCQGTFIVTRVSYTVAPKPIVRTIRLRLNNQNLSVAQDRWDTPTP